MARIMSLIGSVEGKPALFSNVGQSIHMAWWLSYSPGKSQSVAFLSSDSSVATDSARVDVPTPQTEPVVERPTKSDTTTATTRLTCSPQKADTVVIAQPLWAYL